MIISKWSWLVIVLPLVRRTVTAEEAQCTSPPKEQSATGGDGRDDGLSSCSSSSSSSGSTIGGGKENNDDSVTTADDTCDMYLAESSVPNAGWGLYTGKALQNGQDLLPLDVGIHVIDFEGGRKKWTMDDYFWTSSTTWTDFDANDVKSILPGYGMLVNSFVGLSNLEPTGCHDKAPPAINEPAYGSVSECQQVTFQTSQKLPAGHELLVNYGDDWFLQYHGENEAVLAEEYDELDELLLRWEYEQSGDLKSKEALQAYHSLKATMNGHLLPETAEEAAQIVYGALTPDIPMTTAYAALGRQVVRSPQWLEQHGSCVDGIETHQNETNKLYEAFSKRAVAEDQVIAPVPLMHMSRSQMKMKDSQVQQLINYCYGHPSSSLLFFPYGPGINLIRPALPGEEKKSNVALRWSTHNHLPSTNAAFQKLTPAELLKVTDPRKGEPYHLLMELYALEDIAAGEELLLDYGDDWNAAWQKHVETYTPPAPKNTSASQLPSAWAYDQASEIYTTKEPDFYPPSETVQVRCWVDREKLTPPGEDGLWYTWHPMAEEDDDGLLSTEACTVVAADYKFEKKDSYRVILDADQVRVKKVPWNAITFCPVPYTTSQFSPGAFRHEIGLPDNLIPDVWRDLKPKESGGAKEETPKRAPKAEEDSSETLETNTGADETCGLYMATSAIPNSGLGMFSARAITEHERIFYGDVVIQVEDFDENMKLRQIYNRQKSKEGNSWLMHNYYWNPDVSFGLFEAEEVSSVIPGLGMLANSHTGLVNAIMSAPARVADLHRGKDPGAGASTTYHDIHFTARRGPIEAGEEIFVEYGDEWFADRVKSLGVIPLSRDFERADELLDQYWDLVEGDTTTKLSKKVWNLLLAAVRSQPRMTAALPANATDVERVRTSGGTAANSVPHRIKTVEWLEDHGRCLDNIRPGPSTIRQAGKGAFATRKIVKGSVVAPLPLVQLRRHHMDVYDYTEEKKSSREPPQVEKIGKQLLLNYCFGHPESSLLFFPYSPVVNYVNHNKTGFNVRLQWSTLPNHKTEWLERTPDDLTKKEKYAGLILELVATRDIAAGEEIFLDYGKSWEISWEHYREMVWEPSDEDKAYVSAAELNARMDPLRTEEELAQFPYENSQVETYCFMRNFAAFEKGQDVDTATYYKWQPRPYMKEDGTDNAFRCKILTRNMKAVPIDTYTVQAEMDEKKLIVKEVPRDAIEFFDNQYTSDLFLRNAFRHEIGIPDELFPEAWKDLKA